MKADFIPLSEAVPGRAYTIKSISRGKTHTKNLDAYGLTPGTKIKLLFTSPFGDPGAYEVLGAVVALRISDSKHINLSIT